MKQCPRCGEKVAEGRKHTEEDCRKRLMVRLYDEQLANLNLRRRIRELEKRNDLG